MAISNSSDFEKSEGQERKLCITVSDITPFAAALPYASGKMGDPQALSESRLSLSGVSLTVIGARDWQYWQ
jgi:hypothetical protein